jgi:hypothetical protein
MLVQAALAALLLLLAWWLLTDSDQPPESEAAAGCPEPVRPGAAVTYPALEQSPPAAGPGARAQVG